jgi:hypothetical protein
MDAPAVAVSDDGKQTAVAWMDLRAGGGDRDVQWTLGGAETSAADDTRGTQGHPSLVFDAQGVAWCAWEDTRLGPNAQRIFATDSKSRKNVQVSADAEGKAGYPALARAGASIGVLYEASGGVSFRLLRP